MTIMPAFVLTVFSAVFNISMSFYGAFAKGDILIAAESLVQFMINSYWLMFLIGVITTVTEWDQIHTTTAKKIFYTFTFPVFMFTYIPISMQALFTKVEWTPIEHNVSISIDQLEHSA